MLNAGDTLGSYAIKRILGSGAMGIVYLADDLLHNRPVALKLVHSQIARDPRFLNRFKREAETLAMLTHPNIVAMYDVVEDESRAALVMEYVPGEGLDSVINRMGLIPPEKCLPLFRQIGEAVSYSHDRGVVHRDLKPANVMVTQNGTAKVMDFGIARNLERETRLTRLGSSVGTIAYMSPEVAQGNDATESSDLYSLGAMLYEMLTGRLPRAAITVPDLLEEVRTQGIVPPKSIYPYIPSALEDAVLCLLSAEPHDRFPSARACLNSLKGISLSDVMEMKTVVTGAGLVCEKKITVPVTTNEMDFLEKLSGPFRLDPPRSAGLFLYGNLNSYFRSIGREEWADSFVAAEQDLKGDTERAVARFLDTVTPYRCEEYLLNCRNTQRASSSDAFESKHASAKLTRAKKSRDIGDAFEVAFLIIAFLAGIMFVAGVMTNG